MFKNGITLLVLLLVGLQYAVAQGSPQARFDEANSALEADNYSQALSIYKELEQRNNISGALFLNMGITYMRLDSLGYAKYYFMKARQFDETEDRAEQAIEFVDAQFSRQSAVLPKLPWDLAVDWLQKNIGASTILGFAIILLNAGVITFVAKWFWNDFEKILHYTGLSVSSLALLLIVVSFYTQYVDERYSRAVMVTQKAPVMEQPGGDASLVSQAYEGYTFTVDHYRSREHPDWNYVRMSNGQYGWIPRDEIRIL